MLSSNSTQCGHCIKVHDETKQLQQRWKQKQQRQQRLPLQPQLFLLFLILFGGGGRNSQQLSGVVVVSAFPTGAGGCSGAEGSVGGPHLAATALTTGKLELNEMQVTLVNTADSSQPEVTLVPDNTVPVSLEVGVPYSVILRSTTDAPLFKGFLFRLSLSDNGSTVDLLAPAADAAGTSQVSSACSTVNVAGVTHTENALKASAVAVLNVPSEEQITAADVTYDLQVTAVIENNAESSTYYWSSYTLNTTALAGSTTTTGATPTITPGTTATPTATPAVGGTTAMPTITPGITATPTITPAAGGDTTTTITAAPTPSETIAPGSTPTTPAPTSQDSNGINTIPEPTLAPTMPPTLAPTLKPTLPLGNGGNGGGGGNKNNNKNRDKSKFSSRASQTKRKVRKCNRRIKKMCNCGMIVSSFGSSCIENVISNYCAFPRSRRTRGKFKKQVARKSRNFCNKLLQVYNN